MYKYQDRVFSTAGQPIQGVLVTVYVSGTNTLATLYTDDGVTICNNPVSTDIDGLFFFYTTDGRYDIAFSGSAIASPLLLTDVTIASVTPRMTTVVYNPTPLFDAAKGNVFKLVLTGNVLSSTLLNPSSGFLYTFVIAQDAAGGHTFAWPSSVFTPDTVANVANATTIQSFIAVDGKLYPTGPGVYV